MCTLEPDTVTLIYISMNNYVVLLTILNDDTTEWNFWYYAVCWAYSLNCSLLLTICPISKQSKYTFTAQNSMGTYTVT
jgi:hypothetical protein